MGNTRFQIITLDKNHPDKESGEKKKKKKESKDSHDFLSLDVIDCLCYDSEESYNCIRIQQETRRKQHLANTMPSFCAIHSAFEIRVVTPEKFPVSTRPSQRIVTYLFIIIIEKQRHRDWFAAARRDLGRFLVHCSMLRNRSFRPDFHMILSERDESGHRGHLRINAQAIGDSKLRYSRVSSDFECPLRLTDAIAAKIGSRDFPSKEKCQF